MKSLLFYLFITFCIYQTFAFLIVRNMILKYRFRIIRSLLYMWFVWFPDIKKYQIGFKRMVIEKFINTKVDKRLLIKYALNGLAFFSFLFVFYINYIIQFKEIKEELKSLFKMFSKVQKDIQNQYNQENKTA